MALPRRIALLGLIAILPTPLLAQQAEPPGKPPPADPNQRRYADSGRCREGSAFDIANLSAVPIQEVYLRQSGQTGGWGEDRLGSRVLRTRERLSLDPGIGRFDILILRADGRAFTAMRQNPCAISLVQLEADERITIE